MRFDFKKITSDLFHSIEEKVEKLSEKFREVKDDKTALIFKNEQKKINAYKEKYEKEGVYNDNHRREVIPVLKSVDTKLGDILENAVLQNALESGEITKTDALQACEMLEEKLKDVESKRQITQTVIETAMNSPKAGEYKAFVNNKTQELTITNPVYQSMNLKGIDCPYPAIITIDLNTNELKTYKSSEEMFLTNPKYSAQIDALAPKDTLVYTAETRNTILKSAVQEYKSMCEDVSHYVISENRQASPLQLALGYIDARMNDAAQQINNVLLDRAKDLANRDIRDEVQKIVAENKGQMHYDKATGRVAITNPAFKGGHLMLHYSSDGLSSAYFQETNGKLCPVFDRLDGSGGFATIDSNCYRNLIQSEGFAQLLQVEGGTLSNEKTVHVYKNDVPLIAQNVEINNNGYSLKDVGEKTPDNPTYSFRREFNESLENKMNDYANKYRAMQNSIGTGVEVSYNPYNNTINLEHKDKVLSIAFDADGRRGNVYFSDKNGTIKESDCVVRNGMLLNENVFNDKTFKEITKGVEFSHKAIENGDAGKVKGSPQMSRHTVERDI